ncbi:MAG: TRAP transporter substrate-binding protein DctP [Xanthomonadaceae bacterium]|nr:TRAP transporter substrate-binding protein DctP [Xanthomonadaceae bacterium]
MRRRQFLELTAFAAGGAVVLTSTPMRALAAKPEFRMKFDTYIAQSAAPSQLDNWFLDEVVKRSEGRIQIRKYWAQSLNKVGEHLTAVRDGRSEISLISPGYYQANLPVTRGLEWYYRMERADALQKVCRDVYNQFQPLRDEWEKRYNAKVLYWTNWYYAPLVTREPVNSIEDLKGKRIRGYGVATDVIQRLGGTALPMAAPEVYTALERGVLDGVYGFDFVTAIGYKLHEIAPYITDIGDGPHAPATTIMHMGTWNALPDDLKEVINEVVEKIYAGRYAEIFEAAARKSVEQAMKEGARFSAWSDTEKQRAREIVQPKQVQLWIDQVAKPNGIDGEAMQEIVEKAIAKHEPTGQLKRPFEIYNELKNA